MLSVFFVYFLCCRKLPYHMRLIASFALPDMSILHQQELLLNSTSTLTVGKPQNIFCLNSAICDALMKEGWPFSSTPGPLCEHQRDGEAGMLCFVCFP